ncbi:MAG: hypothetical protein HY964_03090 [Ignavibacteriales bacterium]|nr:hypothetical protein [Ignavibacteriales bacterium]
MSEYPGIPNKYIGYLFSVAFLIYEFLTLEPPFDILTRLLIAITGWIYYLYLVYTIHEVMEVRYRNRYSVSSSKAMFMHLIPIYNVYWLYKWPTNLKEYIQRREQREFFNYRLVISFLFIGTTLTRFDFAIGYALLTTAMLILITGFQQLMQVDDPDLRDSTTSDKQLHGV